MPFRILIVDDNAFIRHSLRACLQRDIEWEVCGEAENGIEAVEKVKELGPDIVILDWQMPGIDGLEAARQIRTLAPKTALLLLTLHSEAVIQREAKAAGIDYVLSKMDAIPGRLFSSLREVCGKPGALRA